MLLVSVGALAAICLEVAELLDAQGIGVTVVDPRWVKPVDPQLVALAGGPARRHRRGQRPGRRRRFGVAQALRDAGVATPLRDFGIPPRFLDHANVPPSWRRSG